MRSKEEVINDALHDYNSQIKTWLKTRLHGAWENGYCHGKDGALKEFLNAPPVTNADKIRSMTDEELAEFHSTESVRYGCAPHEDCVGDCIQCWLDWLKAEVE